jgi:energy-coupling factor transport system ATP-binding protein
MSLIVMDQVHFHYPNGHEALKGVSLSVDRGEAVAVVGQNGAGKTSAAKLMNGLYRPSSGSVIVDGRNTKDHTTAQIARTVGYVFQNPDDQLFQPDVYSEIAFGPKILGLKGDELRERVEEGARLAGVADVLGANPQNLPLSTRKFVTIAAALAMRCRAYVLDEPTAGQDARGMSRIARIIESVTATGAAIVTITHDMQFVVEHFERVVAMAGGRIIADGPKRAVFWNLPVLSQAMLKQPYAADLAREFELGTGVLTPADLAESVAGWVGGRNRG